MKYEPNIMADSTDLMQLSGTKRFRMFHANDVAAVCCNPNSKHYPDTDPLVPKSAVYVKTP